MLETYGVLIGGLILVMLGADSFLKGASGLAQGRGVGGFSAGLALVAVGASVPELAIATVALARGHDALAVGTVTDCYQPIERELKLTRSVIELFNETSHPLGLVTKSSGVERDMDLLAPMAQRRLAAVYVTVTTLDAALARTLEPRAAAPHRRLRTIRALADQGVPVGVSVAPQIPFVNDDMEQVLEAAWDAGARTAFYTVLRLPWEVAPLFREWLAVHYPQRADRVMARIHDMRGGKDYDADFSNRMKGQGLWAQLIAQRFQKACARLGFNRERFSLDTTAFRRPAPAGQQALF